MGQGPRNMQQLLDRVEQAAEGRERVSVGMIVEQVGRRSFGPLLLVAGLMLTSPVSGIPGMPTTFGALVLFVSLQLLFRRRHFWLPQLLLRRSLTTANLKKGLKYLRPPARFIDQGLRRRLAILVDNGAQTLIAVLCVLIALCTPLMEVVPFSATSAGVAIAIFGLAIIAHDGLVALGAFLVTAVILGVIYTSL